MKLLLIPYVLLASALAGASPSTQGVLDLVNRRIPTHSDSFQFVLDSGHEHASNSNNPSNDVFTVCNFNGKIQIEGNSPIALARGLHRYLADIVHVDISWFTGSRLQLAPSPLPSLAQNITGASAVPWRYHFNTVTFSYTTAFWSWEDWELQLDWMALRGINLPLAWVGVEKVLIEVFEELGLKRDEVYDFLSGPAFQSWNRFGNIQDSWGGELPQHWVDSQFELQKKIVKRMVELGMTPILPAFTGFVPRALPQLFPNSTFVNGSQWEGFSPQYTNDTFLEPEDELFAVIQKSMISKQLAYYGNVTHMFTLDQFNENDPASGDLEYLRKTTYNTWKSLKNADQDAVWILQGWLFFSNSKFWSKDRVKAYLDGVEVDTDMLILDLFSETQPQWQRLDDYFGKPWIWNELHDYGGNNGIYGQVENVTDDATAALSASKSIVGFGLTMEGQEGNEIMYDLLLDQAWSDTPINTSTYFSNFAAARYGPRKFPVVVDEAWQILLHSAYNNTNLTSQAVTKSILELRPNSTGLTGRIGHHPTTINYQPSDLIKAWSLLVLGARQEPTLWHNEAFTFDLADVSRQVLANAFVPLYEAFLVATTPTVNTTASNAGDRMLRLLHSLDTLLNAAHPSFHLSTWVESARIWASDSTRKGDPSTSAKAQAASDFLAYNARNQVTLWGPTGEISDYASKQWAGLVGGFYAKRWEIWINEYKRVGASRVDQKALNQKLIEWEESWVRRGLVGLEGIPGKRNAAKSMSLKQAIDEMEAEWAKELGL